MINKTLSHRLRNSIKKYNYRKEYIKWLMKGKPLPAPHFVKQLTIRKCRKDSGYSILIESGTYLGEMVEAQRKYFSKVISIELSQTLFENAENRFSEYKNIVILLGDSGELIKKIVPDLEGSAIFWLDGHYSGGNTAKGKIETPVMNELEAIFQSDLEHIILIDDARLFDGKNDYPTLKYLEDVANKAGYSLSLEDDIIRLLKVKGRG